MKSPEYLSLLLPQVIEIARMAGEQIMRVYNTDFDVTQKKDNTPLTDADMAAHDCIIKGLKSLTPDIPMLSEESKKIPFADRRLWNTYWLIDPLDGTREFIKRNGEFTVNIALIDKHRPILGVIVVPVSGITYYAAQSQGAFKIEPGRQPFKINTRKKMDAQTVLAGSRTHRGDSLNQFLAKLGDYEILSIGSSLKSCLVAEGKADIYPRLGPTSEWDTAAAQCIVEQAGGKVVDMQYQPIRYNTKDSLLNPHFLVIGDTDYDWAQFFE